MYFAYIHMSWVFYKVLYIDLRYMYIFYIIFCMILRTWLYIKFMYEGLDNVFVFHNFESLNYFLQVFKKIVFGPIQKFVLIFSQYKLLALATL
jgi:hypothetical protein